ncbi:MAG TPA: lysophospholipid acyltransferase family protein [Cytophagaceae bacterium]|jgi:predicted LPLAT superfamily acyltransferase
MSTWSGKTRGGVTGHKIFIFFLQTFGLNFAYFILRFVSAYYVFFSRESKHIFYFFNKILKYNRFKSLRKLFTNYYIFGQTLLDKVAILGNFKNKITFEFDGEEYLAEIVKNGKGGILISAHIGNWEIAGNFLKRLNAKINIVMFDAEHQKIKKYISKIINNSSNVKIIVIKDDLSHIIEISKALKNNELIGIHGDRFVKGSKTHLGSLFGKAARFPSGPFHLATRFEVPYSYVFALKETDSHYHFYASPPKVNTQDISTMVEEYTNALEQRLLKYPEQWFNYYDFWESKS